MILKGLESQAERTSLSWLRTYLVSFVFGVLLLKIYKHSHNAILGVTGIFILFLTIYLTHYTYQRFSHFADIKLIVSAKDVIIKKLLSATIFISAFSYQVYSLTRFCS